MSDVLSQSEIDALLSALNSGEVDVNQIEEDTKEKKIKKYDFKSPKRLAKDQLKTLQVIHENFSRALNTYLSGYLRSFIQIEVLSVEELSFYEFSNSISNPTMIGLVNFFPLTGRIILEISNGLSFAVIDRILGGKGEFEGEVRAFTENETTILNRMLKQIVKLFVEPWENVIELSPELEKIETNPQFVQVLSPTETIALITLRVNIGEVEGLINVCIPHLVIEPILNKLSTRFWFASVQKEIKEEDRKNVKKKVKKAEIDVVSLVGESYITVEDFLYLQEGDVIKLNKRVEEELEIHVGDRLQYFGKPGSLRGNMSMKVTKVVEKGDEDDDE